MERNLGVIILVVLIALVVGALASGIYFHLQIRQLKVAHNSKENAAADVIKNSHIFVPRQMTSISGKVSKIEDNILTVHVSFPGGEKDYLVKVAEHTRIISEESGPADLSVLPAKMQIKLSDIKRDDNVTVDASEDIKYKTAFQAESVVIMTLPSIPIAPAE